MTVHVEITFESSDGDVEFAMTGPIAMIRPTVTRFLASFEEIPNTSGPAEPLEASSNPDVQPPVQEVSPSPPETVATPATAVSGPGEAAAQSLDPEDLMTIPGFLKRTKGGEDAATNQTETRPAQHSADADHASAD